MRRDITSILILLTLIGGITFGVYYFTVLRNKPTTLPGQQSTKKSLQLRDFIPFPIKKALSPETTTENTTTDEQGNITTINETTKKQSLFQLSTRAVVALTAFEKEFIITSTSTVATSTKKVTPTKIITIKKPGVRYISKSNGILYEIMNETPDTETRVSNSVTPVLGEGFLGNNTNNALLRFVRSEDDETIETYSAVLTGTSAPYQIKGNFLTRNIGSVAISPDGIYYFTIAPFGDGTLGTITSFVDGKKNQLFSSSFSEWNTQWANSDTILLSTKPSGTTDGYVYTLHTKTGEFKKILGNIKGLTALLAPNGTLLLYSSAGNEQGMNLSLINHLTKQGYDLGMATLPEKCVFSQNSSKIYCAVPNSISEGLYPDDWYQGTRSFSDSIWEMTVSQNIASLIKNTDDVGGIDAIHLSLSKDESVLYFINKKDSTPWQLNLTK